MTEAGTSPSRGARLLARFLRRSWQWIVVGVLAVALGVAAYASPGLERADVHLDEGTVYAVKRDQGLAGTVNTQVEEVVAATSVGDTESTVMQHEDTVLIHGEESNTLTPYNASRNRLESPMNLPAGAEVELLGSRLLVVSPQNGRVWFGEATDVLEMDLEQDKAQFEVGVNGLATLTHDGKVLGLDLEQSRLVREVDGEPAYTDLPFELDAQRLGGVLLSAVGDQAVVLDRVSGRIWVEGMTQVFDVSGASNARLLPPVAEVLGGEERVRAVYATEAGLIGVTADGPRSLSGEMGAIPVRPVQLGDCLYGAFGAQFVKRCPDAEPTVVEIPGYDGGATETLSFQINRRTIALNEATSGVVWLVDQGMVRIDAWDEFIREEDDEQDTQGPTGPGEAERGDENRPPQAKDDQLTARNGRATMLDVLDNDSDPDGDVLTIVAPREIDGASLQTVAGGTGLQITIPPENTRKTFTFDYEVSDGFERDSASVTVTVADQDPAKENRPPYPFELAEPVTLTKGTELTKRVLFDWRDPEGDPLILEDAFLPPGSEDLVTFNPDGTIHFQDVGKTTGRKQVQLLVSDGTDVTEGTLDIDVVDEPVKPVAYADFATTTVGEPVTIHPLENDLGERLSLQEVTVERCSDCTVTPDYNENRFTFEAPKRGTYYLVYNVASGPIDRGVVRVDVVEPGTDNPPVAALDTALLPPQGSVFIDPLLNDSDPDGDVLVIQSFTADPSLEVRLERRHLMTIRAKSTPTAPVTVEYVVSDGRHTARGTVVVIPTRTTGSVLPIAEDDAVNVRAGSIASVPVLDNDTSPIGLELTLNRILESPLGDDAWIDGDFLRVRIQPGAQRQQVPIAYEVVDEEGNVASATLTVTAVSEDAANQPPAPREVVDRVLAGSTTRIPIRLDGVDPNGDPVRLVGLGSGPKLGRVTEIGEAFLTYEAFPSSEGTDTFRYEVVDAHGASATGQIRIGVAPPGRTNQPPVAVHDELSVRPGRPIQIPALANDYDFEGDAFAFSSDTAVAFEDETLPVTIVNDREISAEPIAEEGRYDGTYRIQDVRQQEGIGSFAVIIDEGAPLSPPVARDDVLHVNEIIDKDYVEIEVLANDFDPDGPHDELEVSIPGAEEGDEEDPEQPRVVDGNRLSVPVGERMQQVRYRLTDGDGNESYGIAVVPGTEDAKPAIRDEQRVLEVTAGQPVHIGFDDLLVGTEGRSVKLTSTDSISATNGSAVPATGGIEYTPHLSYHGPAAVVFEVIDVVPEGDETAKHGYVTVPVRVRPSEQQSEDGESSGLPATPVPPVQVSDGLLRVAPDEGEFRLPLMPLFQDPKGLDFNFENLSEVGGDAPIEWRTEANNSVIVATAPLTAPRGTTKTISGTVVNAQGASDDFEVVLETVASRQPLTTTVTDVMDEAVAGQPVTLPVTANDVSHVSDKTLTVTSARIVSGQGSIEHDDDSVTITPAEGFVGTLTASYSVQDATLDPSRIVDGGIRLTVTDVPSRPSAPFNGEAGDGQIRFEYRSGSANGHPIERREVTATSSAGSVTQECEGTTCTITGLRNNVAWTLSVVDHNKLGPSEPSPQSAPYTPDVRPQPPAAPEVERGDQQLTVLWQPATFANPDNAGSPVETYTLRLYDSSGKAIGTQEVGGNVLEHTWTGLTNGASYTFSVVATNKAGSSDESARSTAMFPVGPPKGEAQLTVRPVTDPGGGRVTVAVANGTVDANGDPDMGLTLVPIVGGREDRDGARELSFPADPGREHEFRGFGTRGVRFALYAENLHSRVKVGETTDEVIAWPEPQLDVYRATVSPESPGRLRFKFTTNLDGEDLGRAGRVTEYSLGDGNWSELRWNGSSRYWETGELTPGVTVRAQIRIRLTNAENDLRATSEVFELTPVTAEPRPLQMYSPSAYSRDVARVGFPDRAGRDLRMTGGWDPNGYSFSGGLDAEGRWVIVPEGRSTVQQHWRGDEPGSGRTRDFTLPAEEVVVEDIENLTMDAIGRVSGRIRYASGNSVCQLFTGNGADRTQQGGDYLPDSNATITINAGPFLRDDTTVWDTVEVSCRINNRAEGWSWELKQGGN